MVVVDVVVAVRVEVCADVSLMVTDVGERPQVVGLVPPEIDVVTAQLSATEPVNEFDGVTEMVAVLVEPGLMLMLPLLVRVKLAPPLPGACQKSPQPVAKPSRSGIAANNSLAHRPGLIAAPCSPSAALIARRASFKG